VVDGVIEATREDYEHVRVMVNDFLYRVQADTLTPKMNQLLLIIYKKMPHEGQNIRGLTIKQSDLAMELGITQQAVSYNLNKLIEKGYLINVQQFQRKPPQLKLGPEFNEQLMNADKSILLSAEKLGL
jgi:DNA-binding MarR family transcriptional regulator